MIWARRHLAVRHENRGWYRTHRCKGGENCLVGFMHPHTSPVYVIQPIQIAIHPQHSIPPLNADSPRMRQWQLQTKAPRLSLFRARFR